MNETKRQFRNYEDMLKERLANPEYARVFLNVALEEYENDRDIQAFLMALKDVAEAQQRLAKLAKPSRLPRQNLYKLLSREKTPRLETMATILHTLGFRLSIEAL